MVVRFLEAAIPGHPLWIATILLEGVVCKNGVNFAVSEEAVTVRNGFGELGMRFVGLMLYAIGCGSSIMQVTYRVQKDPTTT